MCRSPPVALLQHALFMTPKTSRIGAVRQVLNSLAIVAPNPSEQELQLLTNYVLGHISLEEANELLQGQGRIMVALYEYQLVSV